MFTGTVSSFQPRLGQSPWRGTKNENMQTAVNRLLNRTYPFYRPLVSSLGLIDVMARKHKTDKRTHGYLTHYQQHFSPLRHSTRKLLEIGVGVGLSDSQ
jgi:hypothetical protein